MLQPLNYGPPYGRAEPVADACLGQSECIESVSRWLQGSLLGRRSVDEQLETG